MQKNRLEAFSDGVIAVIITIMVLEMKVPQGTDFAALKPVIPVFLCYVLSFVYVGIYWNNHHHLLHTVTHVNGAIMWANLHLLFWQSLIPFVTGWMGLNHFEALPTALYGFVLFMSAVAFFILQYAIVANQGRNSVLAGAIGRDRKGKNLAPVLRPRHRPGLRQPLAGGRPLSARRRHLVHPGPPHRTRLDQSRRIV